MNIDPIDFADFALVEIVNKTPHCKKHGAMNKTTINGIWRCITVAGYKTAVNGNSKGQIHVENVCRAGCCESVTSLKQSPL